MSSLKFSVRQLLKNPGYSATAILILALGIGANTAVFSFLDRILWRPLPVESPRELVMVKYRTETGYLGDAFVHPLYLSFRDESREVFSGLIAYWLAMVDLNVDNWESEVPAMAVSSDYFSVLGVEPVLGRTFRPDEDRVPGAHPVAVISHELWQRQTGGDRAVIGKTIRLNDQPLTVVGVAPAQFTGTYAGIGPAVYLPLATWAHIKGIPLEARSYDWLNLLGRLKPGVSMEQAQAALRVMAERFHAVAPLNTPTGIIVSNGSRGTNVWTEENLWGPFALVQVVTAMVLLIACANVTNLLLARAATRRREIAIRMAIGAGPRDVMCQLLIESTLLALAGGACGIVFARWSTQALRSAVTIASVANTPLAVDGRILVFALGASLATALACGLIPAPRASRLNLLPALSDGHGLMPVFHRRLNLRNLLVVVQVAITMVVLAVGALCLRSLGELQVVSPGFDTTQLVVASENPGHSRNTGTHLRMSDLKERVVAFPGVQAVALASRVPLSEGGRNKTAALHVDGFQLPPGEDRISWEYDQVGPGYFQALGVPILRGRDFTSRDGSGAARVMIVNELMAQQFWPDQDPIGKRVTFHTEAREVIGVVKAFKLRSIREDPGPLSFWPLDQPMQGQSVTDTRPVLIVRASGDPEPIVSFLRAELQSDLASSAGFEVGTLPQRIAALLVPQRMIGAVLNALGMVGLLFAGAGIFAVMAYEVCQRTREIGIRMALGARVGQVLGWILGKGAGLTLAGIGLGLVVSIVPMALLEAFIPEIRQADQYFLYGVHTWDPLTYALAAAVVMTAALTACWLPARRATRVDPMRALRCE